MQALASAEKQLGGQMDSFYALFENYLSLNYRLFHKKSQFFLKM